MVDSSSSLSLYKVTEHETLKNRRAFYDLRKKFGESMDGWLKRVQICIGVCGFPAIIMEFLLIDRFICGLNANEVKTIQYMDTWTLRQLIEYNFDEDVKVDHNQLMNSVNVESVTAVHCEYLTKNLKLKPIS